MHRRGSNCQDQPLIGQSIQLPAQKSRAIAGFLRSRRPVLGPTRVRDVATAAFAHVQEVRVRLVVTDRLKTPVEEFPCFSNKGDALLVLIVAGTLSKNYQLGQRVPFSEHRSFPGEGDLALVATGRLPLDLREQLQRAFANLVSMTMYPR